MRAETILLVLASYFLGGIPTAYVAGRLLRGIDLRRYGSGTISGSMVYEHVARWAVVPVGLLDVGKAVLPTWLALRLDLGPTVAILAGLTAAAGHNWPPYLGFTGGRGLGLFIGMLLLLFPWGVAWLLGALTLGFILGDSAPWALAALLSTPMLARLVNGPGYVPGLTVAMVTMCLVKRLEANRRPLPPPGPERRRVILRRALLDRDIASHHEWIRRVPDDTSATPDGQHPR